MERHDYNANLTHCYSTKSPQLDVFLDKVLDDRGVHLATSSAHDFQCTRDLYSRGKLTKSSYIICNGFKQARYTQEICRLLDEGFNVIPVLDSLNEIHAY